MEPQHTTIRFEDLGAPIQKLIRSLKGDVSESDMKLLEYVSVKDMARIFNDLGSNREAEQIWKELKEALQERKVKLEKEKAARELAMKSIEEQQKAAEEEALRLAEEEQEEKRRRKEERKKRKEEERIRREAEEEEARQEEEAARQEEERLRQEEEEESARAAEEAEAEEAQRRREERKKEKKRKAEEKAQRLAEEEAAREAEDARLREEEEEIKRKQDKRRRKAEEKSQKLQEEQQRLVGEQAQEETARVTRKSKKQKDQWSDYVKSHPLQFADRGEVEDIQQVTVEHDTKPPPKANEELLNRVYTPKCPNCGAKYAKPPNEWDCPICLRRMQMKIKCWQPDDQAKNCGVCKTSVGRFSRHHCRNCGRVVCGGCSQKSALIPTLGFGETAVKVCSDCFEIPAAGKPK